MTELNCKHCGNQVKIGDKTCPGCGIPIAANLGKNPQRNFILFFITVVIFCIFMIIWLPPDWSSFMDK